MQEGVGTVSPVCSVEALKKAGLENAETQRGKAATKVYLCG